MPRRARQHSAVTCAKTAEPIEMQFEMRTHVDSKKHVLDWGAHWRNLANAVEPSMCDEDAAFCHITLTTCLVSCSYRFARGVFGSNSDHSL